MNVAGTAVALSAVTLRYWFTADGNDLSTAFFKCYDARNAASGDITADVVGTFNTATAANTTALSDSYLELSFSSMPGTLAKNGTATVQVSISGPGSSFNDMFDVTNDYSFTATDTNFTQTPYVTAYVGGTLVWGIEPGIPAVVDAGAGDVTDAGGETGAPDAGVDATVADGGGPAPDAAAIDASVADVSAATPDAGALDAATE